MHSAFCRGSFGDNKQTFITFLPLHGPPAAIAEPQMPAHEAGTSPGACKQAASTWFVKMGSETAGRVSLRSSSAVYSNHCASQASSASVGPDSQPTCRV